jgi:hypothetical protein
MIGCTGAKNTTTNNTVAANPNFPSWYGGFAFYSDSTNFYARATAVADNGETAKIRAEKEARVSLESYIATELEDIRSELERDGSNIVQRSGFIIMLRNSHYKIEQEASISNSEVIESEGIYRGFAVVEVSKEKVRSLIVNGLSSNKSYQEEFTGSVSFNEFLEN